MRRYDTHARVNETCCSGDHILGTTDAVLTDSDLFRSRESEGGTDDIAP